MSDLAAQVAEEIMALVEENPSEPFSFERKNLLEDIKDRLTRFSEQADYELQYSFELGVEEGRNQASEDADAQFTELKSRIEELEQELREEYTKGYNEGFDTAIASETN